MYKFRDKYGNAAIIDKVNILPYKGAPEKVVCYKLTVWAEYDNFVYFVSVYETCEEAKNRLKNMSCGTFREI